MVQRDHGVGGKPREESAHPSAPEFRLGETFCRPEGLQSETGHEDRVFGDREGLEDIRKKPLVILHEGLQHLPVGLSVGTERVGRCRKRSVKAQGLPVPEGVGQRDFGMDPFETVAMKLELPEEGGRKGQGLDGRADVVDKTGKRELSRAGAAADGFFGLHEKDGSEFSFQRDGRSQ
ncbi:MAG: hypothetical protein ACM337_04910, partial [Syntrophaceae bacterium]